MRRILPPLLLVLLLAPLAACKPAEKPAAPAAPASAAAAPTAVAVASTAPGKARTVSVKNDLYEFDYAYPAQAEAIPALKAWLEADLAKGRADLAAEAKAGKAGASDGIPFNAYDASTTWRVVTDLPGWLSLSAATYEYSGGAHPNHGYGALLWDKAANQQRDATSLFTSKAALARALNPAFCAELNRQRAQKRGAPVDPASEDEFDKCIDPTGSTLILGSSDHQHFDRVGVLIGPYEAGPYAEGDFEITLPVSAVVLATVKPEFKAVFALKR